MGCLALVPGQWSDGVGTDGLSRLRTHQAVQPESCTISKAPCGHITVLMPPSI